MSQISQYFNVKISSPKTSKKQVSFDATDYIVDGCSLVDEDGLIKEFNFDMKNGYLMMDVLSIGMRIDLVGGDLDKNEHLFSGFIKELNPKFEETGQVTLRVKAYSDEGSKLGIKYRNFVYPSENHHFMWARKELMYSDIICNLAKEEGIRVNSSNIKVINDKKASFGRGSIVQKSSTDWAFMQMLAEKINCTLWTTENKGISELHLIDNGTVINKLASYTFYFVNSDEITNPIPNDVRYQQKIQDEISYRSIVSRSGKEIQIITADIKLDTSSTGNGFKISQTTNPKTGQTQVTATVPKKDAEGNYEESSGTEKWVLNEAKLQGMSYEQRQDLINLFISGKMSWEGGDGSISAKDYFIPIKIEEGSSRDGEANNTEVEISDGELKSDGVGTLNSKTENIGSKSYTTVFDDKKLATLSSEKKSAVMGRIVRGEMTEDDKTYYKVVDTTPKESKDDATNTNTGKNQNTQAGVDKSSKGRKSGNGKVEPKNDKGKRDDGFSITCKVWGNLKIVPRKSYILEGLGKYSGKYYLYKVTHSWGTEGYIMTLIFTK